jgi:serine/threonine-protein phosphatase 4 catalytic subunit
MMSVPITSEETPTTNSPSSLENNSVATSKISSIDQQIEKLKLGELISEAEVLDLCLKARDLLIRDGNVLKLSMPITLCGDIHGQFHDLLKLFEMGGWPPHTNYLFLGDFVDRGFNSVETFLLLLALKVRYPDRVALIRGNHESRQITQVYGFYDECLRKFGTASVWKYCCDVFDFLSLGALIDETVFAVHGGLSPSLSTIDQLRLINRKQEVPQEGPMADMLWSDPEESITGWGLSPRGAGYLFGPDVARTFRQVNDVSLIARAHQLVMEGYKWMFDDTLVTVWSAPNYCYRCGNVASIMKLEAPHSVPQFILFEAAPVAEHASIPPRKPVPEYFL